MTTDRGNGEAFIGETKVTENNTTTIPKGLRHDAGIGPGDKIGWFYADGEWVVRKRLDADGEEE